MIKKWSAFNENEIRRKFPINAKINLLKDLALELTDIGLKVDVWSGTWKDDESKSIIMKIEDTTGVLGDYYKGHLCHKKEILEFEKTLKSFNIEPHRKDGFSDKVYYYFYKQGKMTDVLKTYL